MCYLKEDESEFLEERRRKDIKTKHSEFNGFCIELHVEKSKEKEVTDSKGCEEDKEDEEGTQGNEQKIEEVDVEKEIEEKKTKKVKEVSHKWGQLNKDKPLCMRKSFSDGWENHLSVKHLSGRSAGVPCAVIRATPCTLSIV